MRNHTTTAAQLINMMTGGDPVALLATGVGVKRRSSRWANRVRPQ